MAISKALNFVEYAGKDQELRSLCNSVTSKHKLFETLGFNSSEFEEAVNMHLVKCQTYEEAEVYQQIKTWFNLL